MGSTGNAASQLTYRVNRTLWRWRWFCLVTKQWATQDSCVLMSPISSREDQRYLDHEHCSGAVETTHPGKIIDWLPPDSPYIHLGWVTPI